MVLFLPKPIEIVKRSGWQYAFRFWTGLPPSAVPDDLTSYAATAALTPIGAPNAIPFEFSTDGGTMETGPGFMQMLVGRGAMAYWPDGNYDFQARVFRNTDLVDRYVIRSLPNKSPLKLVSAPGGAIPIPGDGSNISLPLSFTLGYSPGEVLPGLALVDLVVIQGGTSQFLSLTKPTDVVTFTIRRNEVAIGTAVMDPANCGAGPVFTGVVTLNDDPTTLNPSDYLDWVAPSVVDATFTSGALTLAGS